MAEPENYEKVSIYYLDEENKEKLLGCARECVFNWSTKDGWPMGVIMSCLWKDGRMWLTAGANRHRIAAIRRDPRCSVVVTSTGTELGGGKTVTIKGRAVVHEDRETKDWFYPEFARHLNPNEDQARDFEQKLDSPVRIVVEVTPEKFITYDGVKMFLHTAGKLDESQLGAPKSSDTSRLARELERRGIAEG